MSCNRAAVPAKHLFNGFKAYQDPMRASAFHARSMATQANITETASKITSEAPIPPISSSPNVTSTQASSIVPPVSTLSTSTTPVIHQPPPNPFLKSAPCTLYAFPSLKPVGMRSYPGSHLLLPIRKDVLHRAVIFEGDNTRQGTASTKWRSEVHGSNRKIRPQKGSGKARLGDKKSPMLRGGGVAFGPKPRDFGTELPRKAYDLAWRTALSYRYKKGELMVVDSDIDFPEVDAGSMPRYMSELLRWNQLNGKTLLVTTKSRPKVDAAFVDPQVAGLARTLPMDDVDVKDLLEGSRIIVEQRALEWLFRNHELDLAPDMKLRVVKEPTEHFLS